MQKIFHTTGWYTISHALRGLTLLFPVFWGLPVEQLGLLGMAWSLNALLVLLSFMGLNYSFTRFYNVENPPVILVGMGTVVAIIGWCSSSWLGNLLNCDPKLPELIAMATGMQSFGILAGICLQMERRPRTFCFLNSSWCVIFLLIGMGIHRPLQFVWSFFWTTFLFFPVYIVLLWHRLKWNWDRKTLKQYFDYGLPLFANALLWWGLDQADRLFLGHLLSPQDLGYYSAAAQYASVVTLFTMSFQYTFIPEVFSETFDPKKLSQAFTDFLTFLSIVFGLGLVFGNELILLLSGEKWKPAVEVYCILLFGVFFYGFYMFPNLLLQREKSPRVVPLISFLCIGLLWAGNIWFVPKLGVIGAALSKGIAFFFLAVASLVVHQAIRPFPFEFKKILTRVGSVMMFSLSALFLPLSYKIGLLCLIFLLCVQPLRRTLVHQM